MENPGVDFLKEKYDLHNSPEVSQAAERMRVLKGERVPPNPASLINNYLHRFEEIVDKKSPWGKNRGVEVLKTVLHRNFIIKPNEIPESYFTHQVQVLRDLGQGADWNSLSQEQKQLEKEQYINTLIADQQNSLDTWVDYFASNDAMYPTWLKYYALRSILSLSQYDKKEKEFSRRSRGTIQMFPELNREALSYVLDAVEKRQGSDYQKLLIQEKMYKDEIKKLRSSDRKGKATDMDRLTWLQDAVLNTVVEEGKLIFGDQEFSQKDQSAFFDAFSNGNFAKLYAWAIDKVTPASHEHLLVTDGKWVKFRRGFRPKALVNSLQGKGTGWCTAGESMARSQLLLGDFYVYYSLDEYGRPTIPRVAIRMEGKHIGEVRGVAEDQNVDPYIGDVVQKKLQEFPDGKSYEKKVHDMKLLTDIEQKMNNHISPSREELTCLYEVDYEIEGFGWRRDPRIEEIKNKRSVKDDIPIILDCYPGEIAYSENEISKNTKTYIGLPFPGIFNISGNLEHIYTSFPENRVNIIHETVVAGGRTAREYEKLLKQMKVKINDHANELLKSPGLLTLAGSEQVDLVWLKFSDLGFTRETTIEQVRHEAERLDLVLCLPEDALELRIKHNKQPINDKFVAITKSGVFFIDRYKESFDLLYNINPKDNLELTFYSGTDFSILPFYPLVFRFPNNK